MNSRQAVVLTIIFLVSFITMSTILVTVYREMGVVWLFPELGPSVMQDSYFYRSPGLESPFGLIGDIPGGYSLYSGSPIQSYSGWDFSDWIAGQDWSLSGTSVSTTVPLLIAIGFGLVPVLVVFVLGRRSYGSTKTR